MASQWNWSERRKARESSNARFARGKRETLTLNFEGVLALRALSDSLPEPFLVGMADWWIELLTRRMLLCDGAGEDWLTF
jgi:hypothetical protein